MLFKLAWRNIWRNKWRTFITIAMVFFGVLCSSVMMSFKNGAYVNMMNSMVGSFTGYAQVHLNGYWEEKSLDNSFEYTDSLKIALDGFDKIDGYAPRIESFALASAEIKTKGVMVVGLDPEKENLTEQISKGQFLNAKDREIVIGTGLAKYLKLDVGDTLVMIGQGYHGASAAGKYRIKGLIKFGSPEISNQIVFLPITEAQYYLNAPNQLTAIILRISDRNEAKAISDELALVIGSDYEVMDWNALVPELKKMIDNDKAEGYVFMFILYMVISFGMFGTILMMLSERMHEFGVLISIGMRKMKLGLVVWMEIVALSLLGAFSGTIGAFPICAYFFYQPIELGSEMKQQMEEYGMEAVIQTSIDPQIWITQAMIVFILGSLLALYAIFKIRRINEIEAMRG